MMKKSMCARTGVTHAQMPIFLPEIVRILRFLAAKLNFDFQVLFVFSACWLRWKKKTFTMYLKKKCSFSFPTEETVYIVVANSNLDTLWPSNQLIDSYLYFWMKCGCLIVFPQNAPQEKRKIVTSYFNTNTPEKGNSRFEPKKSSAVTHAHIMCLICYMSYSNLKFHLTK